MSKARPRPIIPENAICFLCGEPLKPGERIYRPKGREPVHDFCKFGEDGP